MIVVGSFLIIACVVLISISRSVARAVHDASWGRLGLPFRPRIARVGIIGAGAGGLVIGGGFIALALTVAAP